MQCKSLSFHEIEPNRLAHSRAEPRKTYSAYLSPVVSGNECSIACGFGENENNFQKAAVHSQRLSDETTNIIQIDPENTQTERSAGSRLYRNY